MGLKRAALATAFLLLAVSSSRAGAPHKNPIQVSPYNLVFTEVKVNGKRVLALIDSGSFQTVELSWSLAQELKLTLTETNRVARRHGGQELFIKSGRLDSLSVGDYERRGVEVAAVEGDLENISRQVGTDFGVVLGFGFLSQFHTLIDYKSRTLQLSEAPLAPGRERVSISYTVVNGVPVVSGAVGGQAVNFLFDTGAPMCNLDLSLAGGPQGQKVSQEAVLAGRALPLEWRAKDLSVIKKTLNCAGVIGNNFLAGYAVYFDIGHRVIRLY